MREFQSSNQSLQSFGAKHPGKKNFRRMLYSLPVVIAVFVFVFLLARGTWSAYQKERYAEMKAGESARELREIQKREGELALLAEHLKTSRGQEEEIRKKFLLGKEGEKVIYLVDASSTPSATDNEAKKEDGFLGRFLAGFFGWFQ